MDDSDLAYAYVAYVRGSFQGIIKEGLKGREAFAPVFKAHLQHVNDAWVIEQELPIGLVVAMIKDNRMEPHVFWYQWATPRNKIEGTIKFLDTMRKVWTTIIYSEEKNHKFFKYIERHGVIRQVGKIHKYFPNGETASVFQTRDLD